MDLLLTIETPKRPKGTDADQGNCKGDSRHPQPDNGRHWQEGGKSLKDDEAQAGANNRAEALALSLSASEHLAAMAVHRILGLDRAHKREPRREAVAAQRQGLGGCGWVGREPFLHDGAGGKTMGATRSPAALSKGTQALAISSRLALLGWGWAENVGAEVGTGELAVRLQLDLLCDGGRHIAPLVPDVVDHPHGDAQARCGLFGAAHEGHVFLKKLGRCLHGGQPTWCSRRNQYLM